MTLDDQLSAFQGAEPQQRRAEVFTAEVLKAVGRRGWRRLPIGRSAALRKLHAVRRLQTAPPEPLISKGGAGGVVAHALEDLIWVRISSFRLALS